MLAGAEERVWSHVVALKLVHLLQAGCSSDAGRCKVRALQEVQPKKRIRLYVGDAVEYQSAELRCIMAGVAPLRNRSQVPRRPQPGHC